jgi:RND family efflux transporter MFP subunit
MNLVRALICAALGLALLKGTSAQGENVSVVGITEPIVDSIVGTPVSGIVMIRRFKEGDFVKQGQVVVELDKALEDLEVTRREVVLEPLKADFDAAKYLFGQPKSSMSKEILDKKQADYKVAVAEYELAKEAAHRRLISAPFDGSIIEFYHQVGESCQIEQPPMFRLVDTRRCYFVCNVDAKAGPSLRLGQPVSLEIESGPAPLLVQATLSFVSPVVDPASGLMKVKAVFENADGKVRPGVAGRMTFEDNLNASARK